MLTTELLQQEAIKSIQNIEFKFKSFEDNSLKFSPRATYYNLYFFDEQLEYINFSKNYIISYGDNWLDSKLFTFFGRGFISLNSDCFYLQSKWSLEVDTLFKGKYDYNLYMFDYVVMRFSAGNYYKYSDIALELNTFIKDNPKAIQFTFILEKAKNLVIEELKDHFTISDRFKSKNFTQDQLIEIVIRYSKKLLNEKLNNLLPI